ncbi:hypothetical protein SAMN05443634_102211 [Chishuiella changwenlii]|uniref:Uncharacterized protein n=1 Tax=Chishuiella changwenlii TaxID=1434701 RepID=A0A1M6U567_9FLAO|nr:hypothetical protein [Chishuiella changwenlii]GGE99951.1 hypothetical protein GCM10010984_16930 [Chishuiella changwenlii]SHK64238.1 hypothetical protein SAMN05443634_102211 [Chishuiella changwenlii]
MKKLLPTLVIICSILSCQDEISNEIKEQYNSNQQQNGSIIEGRLFFKSEEDFREYHSNLDSKEIDQISNEMETKLYSKNFISLVPYISEHSTPSVVEKISKSYSNSIPEDDILEHFDDLEDILGDDLFASLLNSNSEIQIGDDIYKYTDQGLFIVNKDKYNNLEKFILNYDVHSLNDVQNIQKFKNRLDYNPSGGLVQLEDGISHYINYSDDNFEENSKDSKNHKISNRNNFDLESIANNLAECNLKSPFLGNLFGTTKVCINRYQRRRRVKLKYYNVDLKLVYAIGIKVKNQRRHVLWFNERAEKIVLGINSITWGFHHKSDFSKIRNLRLSGVATYFVNNISTSNNPYHVSGRQIFKDNGFGQITHVSPYYSPKLPFEKKLKLDAVVEFALDNRLIKNEEDARFAFYKFAYGKVEGLLNQLGNDRLKRVGVVMITPDDYWVQFYDFSNSCNSCRRLEHVFDWGIMTPTFTYNFGAGSGSQDINIKSFSGDLKKSNVLGISAFGMIKNSNNWHGNKFNLGIKK